jgi:hypothetical protein
MRRLVFGFVSLRGLLRVPRVNPVEVAGPPSNQGRAAGLLGLPPQALPLQEA